MANKRSSILSPEFRQALSAFTEPGGNWVRLDRFIQCCLYDKHVGYYQQPRQRVGRHASADFYTASSLGTVFSELILDVIGDLLGEPLENVDFVEFGPESEKGILGNIAESPFANSHLIGPGKTFTIPRKAVVFSNELFDAQPFRRFKMISGSWREMGVRIDGERIQWEDRETDETAEFLPETSAEGYIIDWPEGAHQLLKSILSQPWNGLFLALDYGLDRHTILTERPCGTGRTYIRHTMGSDLLESPGDADITCHLIWDEMEFILGRLGFGNIQLQRQESLFMRHAQRVVSKIVTSGEPGFSRKKQTLMELVNPGNMGHKFQALSAIRNDL